jgi:histone H2A
MPTGIYSKGGKIRSKGAIGKGKGKYIGQKFRLTKSIKAGIIFPVARIKRFLKLGDYSRNIKSKACVFLASVLEYITAELCELTGNITKESGKKIITPRHISLAIRNDSELEDFLNNVCIPSGGTKPYIHPELLPKNVKA